MGKTMLTANEYADIRGCSLRFVNKCILERKIKFTESTNAHGRKKYLIPFSELTEEQKIRYLRLQEASLETEGVTEKDELSAEERAEANKWVWVLEQWMTYRYKAPYASKAEADAGFIAYMKIEHPEIKLTMDVLYRKLRVYREGGAKALIDRRGKSKKGYSSVSDEMWQAFLYYYLDQSQPSIKKCVEYTGLWAREYRPELYDALPSYASFYRRLKAELPEQMAVLGRAGEKAFDDRCAPYIRRVYDEMQSNDYWIADNHTFDIMVLDKNGKPHRPYLTAFMDARSGIITGYFVTYNPGSQATLYALRRGILKYGIPKNLYVDNGREFLTHDIGGLGHRKKKPKDGEVFVEPPGVFRRLGIKMTNAIVRNAKAKVIERRFRDVKDHFSKLFNSYTGGNVLEKPERLKEVLKSGDLYTDEEFELIVEEMIEGYFNQQIYDGAVRADQGKTRMQVYNEQLVKQRKAKAEDLTLMMLRSTRPQKVGRLGVSVPIKGEKLQYWTDEFLDLAFGKEVYVRYDPDDLSYVRVYDLEDRFMMSVPVDNKAIMEYGADIETVKAGMQVTRNFKKLSKERLKNMVLAECDQKSALELVLAEARRNIEAGLNKPADAKLIEIQRADEKAIYQQRVVGGADLDIMIKNAGRKHK